MAMGASGAVPAARALAEAAGMPFRVESGREGLVVWLDGAPRWVIDTALLAGRPELSVDWDGEERLAVRLRGARWAGTPWSADLTALVLRRGRGWRMQLRQAWGSVDFETDFLEWLRGTPVEATGRIAARELLLDGRDVWVPGGPVRATRYADGRLVLAGSGLVRARVRGQSIVADRLTMDIPTAAAPSALARPAKARTVLRLDRGGRPWSLRPATDGMDALEGDFGVAFEWPDELFDRIHVELSETRRDGRAAVLVAETGVGRDDTLTSALTPAFGPHGLAAPYGPPAPAGHHRGVTFRPGHGLRDPEGRSAAVSLGRLRWAVGYGADGTSEAVVAQLQGASWLAVDGMHLRLGGGIDNATGVAELPRTESGATGLTDDVAAPFARPEWPLEWRQEANGALSLHFGPTLREIVAPLAGALSEWVLPAGARLRFAWTSGEARAARQSKGPNEDRASVEAISEFQTDPDGFRTLAPNEGLLDLSGSRSRSSADANRHRALAAPSSPRSSAASPAASAAAVSTADDTPSALLQLPAEAELVVLRPTDLLLVGFRFVNLTLQSGAGEPRLVRQDTGRPAQVIAWLPGQHVAERVQDEDALGNPAPADPPYLARLAGPSRLAFDLPADLLAEGLPYTLAALLDWQALAPSARITRPAPAAPAFSETAVEAPYRLLLAPDDPSKTTWQHALAPVDHDGRVELWHTRLARAFDPDVIAQPGNGPPPLPPWRAVWSPDHALADPGSDGTFSLRPIDRKDIVEESWGGAGSKVIAVNRLFLSALGAWLDLQLDAPGAPTSLEAWTHRAAMGRDTFVRVVRRGFLLPFGHATSKIEVVERKFQESASGRRLAVLRRKTFLVVRQAVVEHDGRELPFDRVRLRTLVTPPLTIDEALGGLGDVQRAFWVRVARGGGTVDLPFAATATDIEGNEIDLDFKAAWIDADYAGQGGNAATAAAAYGAAPAARNEAALEGQVLALAPRGTDAKAAETAFETVALKLGAAVGANGFKGAMQQATVRVESLMRLLGDRRAVDLRFAQPYLDNGFGGGNAGEVFAELLEELGVGFEGAGDKVGGLVTPNLAASALSRLQGVAGGDLADLASGSFDPKKFLQAKARILGHEILSEILPASIPFGSGDTEGVPRISTRFDEARNCILTEVHWAPPVNAFPPFLFDQGGTTAFLIDAAICAPLDGSDPEMEITGQLTRFAVGLVAIEVEFREITFRAKAGEAMKVTPLIEDVRFGGPLAFVEKLKQVLSSDTLGVGPKIELKPTGVLAGFSIGLPAVAVGVMTLENMRLSAALDLPFTGEPMRLRFAFCERQSPFILTVSMLGGGGFFALSLGADGIVQMEAALEFGAQASMSIGVASGSVGIMAGIYFQLMGTDVELTGYLRVWGELSILGLIHISAEFYLAFTYANNPSRVRGIASLKVRIEILFFEKTFELKVEREFKGGGGGGDFLVMGVDGRPAGLLAAEGAVGVSDLMSEADWSRYCEAFA
jgi:hypothetical protein